AKAIGYRQGLSGKTTLICSRVSHSRILVDASADRHFNRDIALVNRFMTAQSTVAMRRWGWPAIATLAAMATLAALAAAAAEQAQTPPTPETAAPREAGGPAHAIL